MIMNGVFETQYCVYPCPCGFYGDPVKECTCSNSVITRYQKRISGPMLDRNRRRITCASSKCRAWNMKSSAMIAWGNHPPMRRRTWRQQGNGNEKGFQICKWANQRIRLPVMPICALPKSGNTVNSMKPATP